MLLLLSVFSTVPGRTANAEAACPEWIREDQPRKTQFHYLRAFDTPVLINHLGTLYRLPAAYMNTWPTPKGLDILADTKRVDVTETRRFNFAFWMPSGRYVERDRWSVPWRRPCEAGRPPPRPDEFVVEAALTRLSVHSELGPVTPSVKFSNRVTKSIGGVKAYTREPIYYLVRYTHLTSPKHDIVYRHVPETEPQVFFACTSKAWAAPNPSCRGDVYFANAGHVLFVVFPVDAVMYWRDIVSVARTLVDGWRDAATAERTPSNSGTD